MSDEQPIDEFEKRARLFEEMARQVRLNKDAKFGGAFLVSRRPTASHSRR